MDVVRRMATKPWNIGEPGGPAGPFYSVVTQTGGIVALQVVTREMAERIASIPVLTDRVDRAQYELGAARRQYEGSQSALKKAMAELTEARDEIENLLGVVAQAVENFNFDTSMGTRAAMAVLNNALMAHGKPSARRAHACHDVEEFYPENLCDCGEGDASMPELHHKDCAVHKG